LHRALGLRDLVLMNVVAIFAIQWIATAAKLGPVSLLLWVVAMLAFFIPSGLCVMELSSRYPGEGGLYVWVRDAFGDAHGFAVGWCYSIGNLPYFPSVLLFISGVALQIGGWQSSADDVRYHVVFGITLLWAVIGANIVGLERAKWVTNVGAAAMALAIVILLAAAGVAAWRYGSATHFSVATFRPDSLGIGNLGLFASMALGFAGYELAPLMGGEIDNPRRSIPRAILVSGVVIALFYVLGTAALLVAAPANDLALTAAIPEAVAALGERLGVPMLGPLTAFCIMIGTIGNFCAWTTGGARVPFVVGIDRYLPSALGRVHTRFGSPWVALVTVGVATTVMLLWSLASASIEEAYLMLIDMTAVLAFVPLLYMFLALPKLRRRSAADTTEVLEVPGGPLVLALVAGLGALTTVVALIMAGVAPDEDTSPWLFAAKVVGGSVLMIGVGFLFFVRGRRADIREDQLAG
jgi:amino acid transporter